MKTHRVERVGTSLMSMSTKNFQLERISVIAFCNSFVSPGHEPDQPRAKVRAVQGLNSDRPGKFAVHFETIATKSKVSRGICEKKRNTLIICEWKQKPVRENINTFQSYYFSDVPHFGRGSAKNTVL